MTRPPHSNVFCLNLKILAQVANDSQNYTTINRAPAAKFGRAFDETKSVKQPDTRNIFLLVSAEKPKSTWKSLGPCSTPAISITHKHKVTAVLCGSAFSAVWRGRPRVEHFLLIEFSCFSRWSISIHRHMSLTPTPLEKPFPVAPNFSLSGKTFSVQFFCVGESQEYTKLSPMERGHFRLFPWEVESSTSVCLREDIGLPCTAQKLDRFFLQNFFKRTCTPGQPSQSYFLSAREFTTDRGP